MEALRLFACESFLSGLKGLDTGAGGASASVSDILESVLLMGFTAETESD